jgi:hypothetical protein
VSGALTATRAAADATALDPTSYVRHALHSPERIWPEKNCYIDIWIELVHALGLDPHAMLAFTVAIDFEGDQWTFFKPPHTELKQLYGLQVQELYVWRPLLEHALEHLGAGKLISTEADAFWLPDTSGTDYRSKHTKTTIVLESVDVAAQRLNYFHNGGYFTLHGEDFARLFRVGAAPDPTFMPLFAELVRCDRLCQLAPSTLRDLSRALLRKHIDWRPKTNPIPAFHQRLGRDLPQLVQEGMEAYHAWVFGTVRQLGAATELSALYLRWLADPSGRGVEAADTLLKLSTLCKTLVLKIARAVTLRRPLDAAAIFDEMSSLWERASVELRAIL